MVPAGMPYAVPEPRFADVAHDSFNDTAWVFLAWRVQVNHLLSRIFHHLYPRGHLGVTRSDWSAMLLMIPSSLVHHLTLPRIVCTLQEAGRRPGAHDVLCRWGTDTNRLLVRVDHRVGIVAPEIRPDLNRWWWGVPLHALTVQVVNLFLCQEGPYEDEPTRARMATLGFHQQNEVWAVEICLATLVFMYENWYFWELEFRPSVAAVTVDDLCQGCGRAQESASHQ